MNKIKTLMTFFCVRLLVLGMVSSAVALPITPSTGVSKHIKVGRKLSC